MDALPEPKEGDLIGKRGSMTTQQGINPAETTSIDHNGKVEMEIPALENTSEDTPEQKKAARKYRWRLIMGLLLPSILEALDTTIIAAALSFIASEFSRRTCFQTELSVADSFQMTSLSSHGSRTHST